MFPVWCMTSAANHRQPLSGNNVSLHTDEYYMQRALHLAVQAEQQGEVPVGCVIVLNDDIIGEGHNQSISQHDPSAHAEMVALRAAAQQQQNYRLPGATLYVTLEPCMMCLGAMIHARIARLVFGAFDPKTGVVCSCDALQNKPFVLHDMAVHGGVLEHECSQQLKQFFKNLRRCR